MTLEALKISVTLRIFHHKNILEVTQRVHTRDVWMLSVLVVLVILLINAKSSCRHANVFLSECNTLIMGPSQTLQLFLCAK